MVTFLEIGNDSSVTMIDDADSNSTGGISSNDNDADSNIIGGISSNDDNYFTGIASGNDDKSTRIEMNVINNIIATEEKQEGSKRKDYGTDVKESGESKIDSICPVNNTLLPLVPLDDDSILYWEYHNIDGSAFYLNNAIIVNDDLSQYVDIGYHDGISALPVPQDQEDDDGFGDYLDTYNKLFCSFHPQIWIAPTL